MNQYCFKKECKELHAFPHISEFALRKISTIQFDSFTKETSDFLRFYYVIDGRFDWIIKDEHHILYPGDLAVVLPGESFGGEKGFLDIGTVSWMHLELQQLEKNGKMALGNWSRLTDNEARAIGRILLLNNCSVLSKLKEAGNVFQTMHNEFINQEVGYTTRINQLIDEMFILIAR